MPPAPHLSFQRSTFYGKPLHHRADHLLLKVFSQDDSLQAVRQIIDDVMAHVSFEVVGEIIGRWSYLRVAGVADLPLLIGDLNRDPRVQYAEPDLRMKGSYEPDDPLMAEGASPRQWGLENINLYEVWETQRGNTSVLIGLIDSGVPLKDEHYDSTSLHDRLTAAIDHVDFEGSRFIAGYNRLFTPPEPWPKDEHGYVHGTNMAGIIAAQQGAPDDASAALGIAGINWGSPVYVAVALDPGNNSTVGLVYQATAEILAYAAANGNPNVVINLSINYEDEVGDEPDLLNTMNDMFQLLVETGAVMCVSVGDGYVEPGGILIEQPALLAIEGGTDTYEYASNVLVVGAVDKDWAISEMSGRGMKEMVFAPGEDIATTDKVNSWEAETGSSIATAHVTGLVSLLWSEAPYLKADELVRCVQKTCRIPEVETEYLSNGVVDASAALQAVRGTAELLTPSIVFEEAAPDLDHQQDIKIRFQSCRDVTLTVTTTGHDFGVTSGNYSHDPCSEDDFILTVTYGATAGNPEEGAVQIVWDQNPSYRWEVGISGDRSEGKVSICLVLDKSGSMGSASGIGSYDRLQVLKYSAGILIDSLEPGHSLGLVAFDHEADELAPLTLIAPEDPGSGRTLLKNAVDSLGFGGQTSIAAGILEGREMLDAALPGGAKALIVLTDGRETHDPWLEEILVTGIPYPVYAIGMGTAESLQPDALDVLAGMSAGYCVLTGELDDETEYAIAEFLVQILADVTGESVVFDPTQRLRPDLTHRFPVPVGAADKRIRAMVMAPPGAPFDLGVVDPEGERLDPEDLRLSRGDRLQILEFDHPGSRAESDVHPHGIYHVEISLPRDRFDPWLKEMAIRKLDVSGMTRHGVRYALRVHAVSDLGMTVRVAVSGYEPGSTFTLMARLTDKGRPMRHRTRVTAEMKDPLGTQSTLPLVATSPGVYTAKIEAAWAGTYHWKFTAEGMSATGQAFRRECRLTAAVWIPAVGGRAPKLARNP